MTATSTQDARERTASDDSPSMEVLVERARTIADSARGRADETDGLRRIPDATIAELWDAGLMRLVQPKRFGGLGRGVTDLYELVMRISQGCASTGWVYCVLAGHSHSIAQFPVEVQEEVWGDNPRAIASSALAPTGQSGQADGGYRLSGKFPFSSGCDHVQWALLGAMAVSAEGHPVQSAFLVPMSELSITDDWHTLGLVGTGSKTIVADDVFVPARRVAPFQAFLTGTEPFSLQAPLVGAALGGLRTFIAQTNAKPAHYMTGLAPKQSDHIQAAIGTSFGEVSTAWLSLTEAVRRTEELASRGEPIPPLAVAENRSATAVISRLTLTAVERVYELSGGHGTYNGHLSRVLRDVRAGTQHVVTNPYNAGRMAGSILLDLG